MRTKGALEKLIRAQVVAHSTEQFQLGGAVVEVLTVVVAHLHGGVRSQM